MSAKVVAYKPVKRLYYIVYSVKKDIVHHGYNDPNQVTTTGQEKMEVFEGEAEWKAALKKNFAVDVDAEQIFQSEL